MIRIRHAAVACAAAVAIASIAAAGAQAQSPLPINVGWVQTPGHLAPLLDALAQKHPEVMPHDGKTYIAKALRFKGTTPQIEAMAANELEVASFAPSALALAITNAHLDVRVVSDVIQTGAHGYFDQPYMVRKDGPIKTIADVKGKRIATNTVGSASDAAMRVMFHKHGIQDNQFTTVEANFANMVSMIEDNKVDLIAVMPQFEHRLAVAGNYRTLFTMGQAIGPSQTVLWGMRADFIKAHRAVMVDFFEDHIRGVRWFLDPKNHAEALTIAEQVTKQKPEDLAYAFTKKDFYRSPDCKPNIAAAQADIDEAVKLHVLPKAVKLEPKYVDLSLIEDAKRRIDGK
ncbi:MAG: ABC transporter substrate-binding protein [Alphaproteobacteria bacterium]|nr:ABC transporter substrate-binding protein [Alphaproteobacteria bacterium]